MNAEKQTHVHRTKIELPCSIGDTVYVTKSYYDEDGYLIQAVNKAEVKKITAIMNKKEQLFFQIDTWANSYGTWLEDTFPDEESARASFVRKDC